MDTWQSLEKMVAKVQSQISSPDKDGHTFYLSQLRHRPIHMYGRGTTIERFIFTIRYNCVNQIPSDFRVTNYCNKPGCLTHLELKPPQVGKHRNTYFWRKEVLERDNYQCQICSNQLYLVGHHLNAVASFPEQICDVDNGITLCRFCHKAFHHKYGSGRNTQSEFIQFKDTYDYKNCEPILLPVQKLENKTKRKWPTYDYQTNEQIDQFQEYENLYYAELAKSAFYS